LDLRTPLDPLVVRLFAPSNKRMVSAGRCCRRDAPANNAGLHPAGGELLKPQKNEEGRLKVYAQKTAP
jgi:hypothetical protein